MDSGIEIEKLRAELNALRKRQNDLQAQLDRIVEITAGIIYVLDTEGLFSFVNNAVEEILHYSPSELIGKHFSSIMTVSEYEKVSRTFVLPKVQGTITGHGRAPKLFDERRSGKRRTRDLEVQLLTREQREVKVFLGDVAGIIAAEGSYDKTAVDPAQNKGKAFLGSQGIIFDITKFKLVEREKFELQKRLFEVQKTNALGHLAGGIAHDFNNKLATIIGCTDMIRETFAPSNKELEACLVPIISASWHAADLTNRLFDFSTKNKYQMVTINIHNIINNVIELLQHSIDRRVEIRQELKAEHPILPGNPILIQSAVLNLAMNACDAMAAGGDLLLKTDIVALSDADKTLHPHIKVPAEYLRLSVVDTGKGMDEATVNRLLNLFYSPQIIGNGIGMGLASAFGCIRDHEGLIEIASRLNEGTTVSVYLPFLAVENADPLSEEKSGKAVSGSGKILVVDDEESLCSMTKKMLDELGYAVVTCGDGQEAVDYYRANHADVDLVIFDMVLPKLSGRDCFKALKTINTSIKAILFTGYSFNEEAETILKDGVLGFIHKPFDRVHLSQVVAQVMKK